MVAMSFSRAKNENSTTIVLHSFIMLIKAMRCGQVFLLPVQHCAERLQLEL